MTKFILGDRSTKNLKGVHPKLVEVVKRALELSPVDFTVIECATSKHFINRSYSMKLLAQLRM